MHAEPERPLRLGLSVGHPKGATGSVGPFVRLKNGKSGFLSSGFVLAPEGARTGDYVHQPGRVDADLLTGATRAGTLGAFIRAQPGRRNDVDAAVTVLGKIGVQGNVVPAMAPDAGRRISGIAHSLNPGDVVAFVGRTSGYSEGRVSAVDFNGLDVELGKESLTFDHCIEVEPLRQRFSAPGDSGALVWRRSDMTAVGLVLAAGESDGRQVAYLLPVDRALSALDLQLL